MFTENNVLDDICSLHPSRLIQTKSRIFPSKRAKNHETSCDVDEFGERNRVIFFVLEFWVLGLSEKKTNAKNGGGGEIRTHGGLASSPVFKTGAFNRSATPPFEMNS